MTSGSRTPGRPPWAFVGRVAELRRLTDAATGVGGAGLLVGGPPGVGKSRLLREAAATLDPARYAVLTVTATAATAGLPLAALAAALPAVEATTDPAGTVRETIEAVRRTAAGRPAVLAIDDAHQLDPLSAALVHHLVRTRTATVVATLCSDAPAPGQVRALWIDDLADRLDLGPLTGDDVGDLLRAVLAGPVEPASATALWRMSTGNALLLRELVLAARAGDDLVETYGVWRWTGGFALTPTLTDVVDHRLGRFEPAVRDVLEMVAFGAPIGLPLLVKATDGNAVETAEDRGLITVRREDRRTTVALAHPLHGEVVRRRCPLTRVRRLQAELAHLIEATGARRDGDLLRIAGWRIDSGTAHDPNLLLRACREAAAGQDLALAARLGRAALDAGGGADVAAHLAGILFLAGRGDDAAAVLETVPPEPVSRAGVQPQPDDRVPPRADCLSTVLAFWGRLDPTAADARVPPHLAALMRLHLGEPLAARRLASAVLEDPGASATSGDVARVTMAHLLAAGGAPVRARPLLAATTGPEDAFLHLAADLALGTTLLLEGDLAAADGLAADRDPGRPMRTGYRTVLAAQVARIRGDLGTAGQLAAQASALLADTGPFAALAHAERAHVAALTGDAPLARVALADADRLRTPCLAVLDPWLEHARAWVAVAAGDPSAGVFVLRRLIERLIAAELHGHELLAQLDLVRLGAVTEAAERTPWLATYSDNPFAGVVAWYADAVARHDGAALVTSIMEFQDLGMNLYAAEAAAVAVGRLREVRSSAAAGAAAELARLLGRCPGARTPALQVRQPALTRREIEIAGFAAAGVASKEIAERLYLSPRTVDNHLMRVYAKLGVSGRTGLAAALAAVPDLGSTV